jgi:hypothetical protein
MANDDRFKQTVVATIAKRAANRCSNPDCGALTSGPTEDPAGAINVGEAAHIYGAHAGSARYDAEMVSADRSAITNAIWLCGNCHKMVDDDPARYPAGLLFEWQKNHEKRLAAQVGKAGAELRQRYETRHLEEFGQLSYLAERLVIEKGDLWEYRLTAEVLRYEMAPTLRRWSALKRGLYMKPAISIALRNFGDWFGDRMREVRSIGAAFAELMNYEFHRAWGEPGVPGNDMEIVSACRLFAEMCASALVWEEQVHFVKTHAAFDDVITLLQGVAGGMIDEAERLPAFLAESLRGEHPSGTYTLKITITLPEDWSERIEAAMERAADQVIVGIKTGDISY